jgi:molybdopterin/thiamine biosynthesis adenylyltransferase
VAHVVVIGAGLIGSHALPHLARSPRVSRITIVDVQCYEPANIHSQDVDAHGIGRPKAVVQARRLRRINPSLALDAIHSSVEDLPLGALRGDVILACLDSRQARMTVNQAAWRLGVPWIDAGVEATGLLARVHVFVPAPNAPCLECAWDQRDYAAIEQRYPCDAGSGPAPTGASSSLGALAAALQAIECDKLLAGSTSDALVGRNVLIDARHHKHYVTAFRRNPACRMPDHDGWRIEPFDGAVSQTTLGELLALGTTLRDAQARLAFHVAGQRVAVGLTCVQCATSHPTFQLERALRRTPALCDVCHGELRATGFDLRHTVALDVIPATALDVPVTRLGLRAGDVLSLSTPTVAAHYELAGDA